MSACEPWFGPRCPSIRKRGGQRCVEKPDHTGSHVGITDDGDVALWTDKGATGTDGAHE